MSILRLNKSGQRPGTRWIFRDATNDLLQRFHAFYASTFEVSRSSILIGSSRTPHTGRV